MAPPKTAPDTGPMNRIGLRERNKIRTRAAIRDAAMALFAQHGYAQTTVEQIAASAEVSHTTFFRYFTSKEQVVLDDGLEEARQSLLEGIPPGMGHFDLVRHLVTGMHGLFIDDPWASNPERLRLLLDEPALRLANQVEADASIFDTNEFVSDYLGKSPDDQRLRVFMAAVGGVMFRAVEAVEVDNPSALLDTLLEAIDLLEQGLPL
ncbi:TetR family transcriptional regulator [Gordonia sp. CPCC 205515]|uniref:TetR family transcriptional regulator n=1 Tax=Gordonia sp. CPCC 205515 TaxID=3140791 RepID=UPI003AF3EF34